MYESEILRLKSTIDSLEKRYWNAINIVNSHIREKEHAVMNAATTEEVARHCQESQIYIRLFNEIMNQNEGV